MWNYSDGSETFWKSGFVVSDLVVGSGKQNNAQEVWKNKMFWKQQASKPYSRIGKKNYGRRM